MSGEDGLTEARRAAARIAARAEIRDVRLFESSITLEAFPPADSRLRYSINVEPRVDYEEGGDTFVVRCWYTVGITRLTDEGDSEASEAEVASIRFEYGGLYGLDLDDDEPAATHEELSAFSVSSAQLSLWPYAREYVYDTTNRLGLPSLTIGMFRIPVTRSEIATETTP